MKYDRRRQNEIDAEHRRRYLLEKQMQEPGGRAHLLRERFLDEEGKARSRAAVATDAREKARLIEQANEFHRMAEEQASEARLHTMKDAPTQIRARMRKQMADVAMRWQEVHPKDDERFPPDYQLKRQMARQNLLREWQKIESSASADLNAWAEVTHNQALALYQSDPVGDAAHESRRVSQRLESQQLATPFVGQSPQMVKNRLHPFVRQFIAQGNLDRARVFLDAGKIAGVEDGMLEQALAEAEDQSIPHRKQAIAQERAIADERDVFLADMYGARIVHGIGSNASLVEASTMQKMIAWRQREGLYPEGAGASSPNGTGARELTGEATGEASSE